jgi:hypothetical protein
MIIIILFFIAPFLSIPLLFAETSRSSIFEIHGGYFTPNIDDESGLTTTPYKDIFKDSGLRFGATYSFEIIKDNYIGTISVLSGIEYFHVSGYGRYENDSTQESSDETILTMIPMEVALVYNLDQLQNLFEIPFVFYVKIGLNYNLWWTTNGLGNVVDYEDNSSIGGKKGWHYGLGLRFLLDFLDSEAAVNFDNQYGINNSYLFIEFNSSNIDDFGGNGFKLGGDYVRFGLALEF